MKDLNSHDEWVEPAYMRFVEQLDALHDQLHLIPADRRQRATDLLSAVRSTILGGHDYLGRQIQKFLFLAFVLVAFLIVPLGILIGIVSYAAGVSNEDAKLILGTLLAGSAFGVALGYLLGERWPGSEL